MASPTPCPYDPRLGPLGVRGYSYGETFPPNKPPGQRAVGPLAVRKKNARRLADQQDLKEVPLDFSQRKIAAAGSSSHSLRSLGHLTRSSMSITGNMGAWDKQWKA